MKYIVYKQPEDNIYPWELGSNLFMDSGYILSTISDKNSNVFDWVKWKAVEVTEEFANFSLWSNCIIKEGMTERYRKWMPDDLDLTKPTLDSHLTGTSSIDTQEGSLKYVLSDDEIYGGGEWNKFIMNLVVQEVFDSRYQALNAVDNNLEQSTWNMQLQEAQAYKNNSEAPTPLLDALVANRDILVSDLVDSIINANDIYNLKVMNLLNAQKKVQDQIKSSSGIDDTLLLKEDLLGIMVESGLAISSGRAEDDNRTVEDDSYGIQF